ncbi:hypothetical protein L7F22_050665 [Adiantum nelumboides]|nr:hypothetical protein [Adiantum nelumboides]
MASPSSTSLILGPDSEEKLLLEFRAGKMIVEATTVKPDLRKGFFRLLRKRLAIRVLSQDCAVGPCERNWSTWALFHTKKRNKLTTLQLERLVFCNCNLQLLDRLSNSPEPTQVNVDKIDIEKVRDIPDIPQEERDLYALLYEEAIAPVHDTRRQRQQRREEELQMLAPVQQQDLQSLLPPHLVRKVMRMRFGMR